MGLTGYRDVLGVRDARRVVVLGLVVRIPLWAANVVLTLHVVSQLHRSYGEAGLLTGLATVALALSGIWLGRRLDRVGLRRTLAPCLVVLVACWSVAPFVGYWPLTVLAVLAASFEIPTFSIIRQALIRAVPDEQRRTALSVDSVAVEISFMIGPVVGVLLATSIDTSWALLACELASVSGGAALWWADPRLGGHDDATRPPRVARRAWLGLPVASVLLACAAATIVLTGTDVSVVAALRHLGHQSWIGWMLAVWGLGSALGGVVYGALRRSVPVFVLLALLAVSTAPIAIARGPATIAALLLVAGFFCAPTITATVDTLTRSVPEHARGEALGWHGAALTTGSAVGAPLVGMAIDSAGWRGGFVLCALVGLLIAVVGAVLVRVRAVAVRRARALTAKRPAFSGEQRTPVDGVGLVPPPASAGLVEAPAAVGIVEVPVGERSVR